MSKQTKTTKFPTGADIERSTTRIWENDFVKEVVKQCKAAGYDVKKDPDTIHIGMIETQQLFLFAFKRGRGWVVRYDQKLFDENYKG